MHPALHKFRHLLLPAISSVMAQDGTFDLGWAIAGGGSSAIAGDTYP